MAEARFFGLIFFNFRITRTSVNTDVFGRFPEVRVNEVLLYVVAVTFCSRSVISSSVPNYSHKLDEILASGL